MAPGTHSASHVCGARRGKVFEVVELGLELHALRAGQKSHEKVFQIGSAEVEVNVPPSDVELKVRQ